MSGEREGVDVGALRTLAEAATPGPWVTGWPDEYCWVAFTDAKGEATGHESRIITAPHWVEDGDHDAAFIAAANPAAITTLLDRLAAAEGALARVREALDSWGMGDSRYPTVRAIDADLRAALNGAPAAGEGER